MQLGTAEHYDMIKTFEAYIKGSPIQARRLDKEAKELWKMGQIYQDGNVNNLFHLYAAGYANARCVYIQ